MSLRSHQKTSRKMPRAGRRNTTALARACDAVVPGAKSWESLESRVLFALAHHYPMNDGVADPATLNVEDTVGTNEGTLWVDVLLDGKNGVEWRSAGASPAGGTYLHFEAEPVPNNTDTYRNKGGRVDLAEDLAPTLGVDGTVVAWMRLAPLGTEVIGSETQWRAPAITGNEQDTAGNDVFYGWVGATGRVGMQRGDTAGARSTTTLADGTWHHVAVSRESATGQVRVYIDGVLQSTATSTVGPSTGVIKALGALTVVAADSTTILAYNHLNNADLDDVRIYNNVLTPAEIAALAPGGAATAAPAAPTGLTATANATNGSLVDLSFTDAAGDPDAEGGFILERAPVVDGVTGTFARVAQLGASPGTGGVINYVDSIGAQFGRQFTYRVRAFNTIGESANATSGVVTSGTTAPNAVSSGYLNSQFWGVGSNAANVRVWPTDENLTDGFTAGGGEENVGTIRLEPTVPHDPADPTGIAVRNPDITELNTLRQFVDPLTGAGMFQQNYDARPGNSPAPGIRADNHSTIHTGKIIIDDGDETPGETISVRFFGNTDDDGHLYVDGRLVSTDPNGHGVRNPVNVLPAQDLVEGSRLDFVFLQAEGNGGTAAHIQWTLDGGALTFIPATNFEAGPSVPGTSEIVPTGTPNAHQVSFNITDNSKSEQRFELFRKLATDPDSAYQKVNEVGINSKFINDASARPGMAYTYVLRGFNFASGYGAAGTPVTVTTGAEPAPTTAGLQAFYMNDEFWGQGGVEPRPLGRNDVVNRMSTAYVGFGEGINSADVHEVVPQVNFDFGGNNHNPATRPGGSAHAQIRDNATSTVFTGKLVITTAGDYQIFADSDDDSYVFVDGILTSQDPNGHGFRDPRVNPNRPYRADRFTQTINLAAGEHDIVVMQNEGNGGAGIRLQWVTPAGGTRVAIPSANLNTNTPAPTAGVPTLVEGRGNNAVLNFVKPAGGANSELKNVVELATDAAFTQNYRKIILGPGTQQRIYGLTANTEYFARSTVKNFEGESTSEVGTFNSGAFVRPDPTFPNSLTGRAISPTQVRLNWLDDAVDEDNMIVQRRKVGETDWVDAAVLGRNVQTHLDNLDPAAFPIGTDIEYRIVSRNAGGESDPSNVVVIKVGGAAGGTGLARRVWDNVDLSASFEGANRPIGEPLPANSPPTVNDIDAIIDDNYGNNGPTAAIGGDSFAIEWVGEIVAEETKNYEFSIAGDNGIRLYLNDVLVIDGGYRDGQAEVEYWSHPIALTAGQKLKARLQFYENGGGAIARLRWNGLGNAREPIPTAFLLPTIAPEDVDPTTRPVTQLEAFSLPAVPAVPNQIGLRWQDNAFGEGGYEIQRSTAADFSADLVDLTGPAGKDQYTDQDAALVGDTTYYYRVRPTGATAWSTTVSAKPSDISPDFTMTSFASQQGLTLNRYASIGGDGRLRLTYNRNNEVGTAFFNRAFDITRDWKANFDFVVTNQNGADGFSFIMHNYVPFEPTGTNQLNAVGGRGGALGYAGGNNGAIDGDGINPPITESVAVTFDFHDNIDQLGVYTQGQVPAGGNVPATIPDNAVGQPHAPNNTVNLRRPDGTTIVDINGGTIFRVFTEYDVNDAGTPEDPSDDTEVMTLKIATAAAPNTILYTTSFAVDLVSEIGGPRAVFGFGAGTGGLNARQQILNFNYDGPVEAQVPITDVYVRGSSWLGDDGNAGNVTFKEFMQSSGVGHSTYGYLLPAAPTNADTVSWINTDEIVLRYAGPVSGAGVPTPGSITVDGTRQDYTVTTVTALDDRTFVLRLDRPLGNIPGGGIDGDRIRLTVPGAGVGGANFSRQINVLQGDASRDALGRVNAADQGYAKARLNRTTNAPTSGTQAAYTVFADVNGDGRVNAVDQGAIKSRINDGMPATAPAGSLFSDTTRIAEEVLA